MTSKRVKEFKATRGEVSLRRSHSRDVGEV